ncbi:hypothetical protein [Salinigranum marinum]|uniref:hypothetical protein n=1 Tax=Salinigranum marinum TaxID=1515595 RepID=UPI002989D107|nr:hypothetical protein [Salinigranum marinum]
MIDGRAAIAADGERSPVAAGDVVVEPGVDHRLVDIEKVPVVLVFFAPAEGTLAEA